MVENTLSKESSEREKLDTRIAFRLPEAIFKRVAQLAKDAGQTTNTWCQAQVVEFVQQDQASMLETMQKDQASMLETILNSNELAFEQIALLRYLVGNFAHLIATDTLNAVEWKSVMDKIEADPDSIIQRLTAKTRLKRALKDAK